MTDREFPSMNEQEFDDLLKTDLAELPPSPACLETITPWRQAMERVFVGLALNAITLQFALLHYILPLIGNILILLGFRTLRRENLGFKVCWVVSVIRLVIWFSTLTINATIWQADFYQTTFAELLTYGNLALQLIFLLSMKAGFRLVQAKAGLPIKTGVLNGLIFWHLAICALAVLQYVGWIIFIILVIVYICIVRSLFALSAELAEAGYVIQAAPVRLTDQVLVYILCSVLFCGILVGYLFLDEYPMEWSQRDASVQEGQADIRTHLLELGFPETILDDLTREDLSVCQGALDVFVSQTEHPVNTGRQVTTTKNGVTQIYTVYDVKELRLTGVAVQLPGEPERWKLFHHFEWIIDHDFHGTEAIKLWPAYRNCEGWLDGGALSGQVLYNEGDKTYASPYFRLDTKTYQSESFLFGPQTSTDLFAEFSFPNGKERCRGYVSYDILEGIDGYLVNSWINYYHQLSRVQYPVKTGAEFSRSGSASLFYGHVFHQIQNALQFQPTEAGAEPLS